VSEIARQTGRDRKTVRRVLEEAKPRLHRRVAPPRGSKLDPFREYLLRRVDEGCLNGAVLLEEIKARGYGGKVSILRQFLTPIRQERIRRTEATTRFETEPGKQAQVDWASFGRIWVPEEERWRKLSIFLFTLGYSRALYAEFTLSADMEHFAQCHLGAFGALGIPQEILYDNLKTGILGRRADGTPILPGQFADFALYYGFTPRYCQPYRARTKGKIERGVSYVRENFWVRVMAEVEGKLLVLGELNERVRDWAEKVANERVHGTHEEVVRHRYAEEQPLLGKLQGRPLFDTAYHSLRRVGRDGRLSYRGQLYQVGLRHALSEVEVVESLLGDLTMRSALGEKLRWEVVTGGKVAAPEVVMARDITGGDVGKKPGQGLGQGGSRGSLLRLIRGGEPTVQRRELAVYEEVARASRLD
jgi:transposase